MNSGQLLHAAGIRKTKAREIVLQVLKESDRPLSHQEIADLEQTRVLDRVTLYRTLTTLQKAGLLHRVQGVDGVWRFRGHQTHSGRCGGNHIHFLCLKCSQMSCLPEQPLPWIKEPDGAEVFGKQLVVYGRCARCKAREDDEKPDKPKDARDADGSCRARKRLQRGRKSNDR
ncbi:MAG: transcriptional repressor [Deltaproteobacteria bacterium]|nr:transcriptional repressor [Deltaproteobacteria bacterium]